MKAEPDSRIEKSQDVKFSIDDLQAAQNPEPWDGIFSPCTMSALLTWEFTRCSEPRR